jgi:membrane-bound metal-dependent hydrolase YbcI (DUF457 family)
MKGITHKIFGAALAVGAGEIWDIDFLTVNGAVYLGTAVLTSVAPDLDLKLGLKHRGASHYFITSAVLTGLTYAFTHNIFITTGAFIGLLSHLIGDMNTVYGVHFLAPFSHKRFRFPWAYRMPKDRSMHPLEMIIFILCGGFLFSVLGTEQNIVYRIKHILGF